MGILTTVCLQVLLGLFVNGLDSDGHCGRHSCPKYEILKKTDEFEIRRYPAYSWAVAREEGLSMHQASRLNFWKLFRYIAGHNQKRKIPMTVPVMSSLIHKDEDTYVEDFDM